MYETLIKSTL